MPTYKFGTKKKMRAPFFIIFLLLCFQLQKSLKCPCLDIHEVLMQP